MELMRMALGWLVERGAGVDWQGPGGKTGLHLAAEAGYDELFRVLIEFRADPEIIDDTRCSVLMACCWGGLTGAALDLLMDIPMHDATSPMVPTSESGLWRQAAQEDVSGWTVLHFLASSARLEGGLLVARLREVLGPAGLAAAVQQRGPAGTLPLHLAAAAGSLELCKILVAAKASPSTPDDNGYLPSDYACHSTQALSLAASASGPGLIAGGLLNPGPLTPDHAVVAQWFSSWCLQFGVLPTLLQPVDPPSEPLTEAAKRSRAWQKLLVTVGSSRRNALDPRSGPAVLQRFARRVSETGSEVMHGVVEVAHRPRWSTQSRFSAGILPISPARLRVKAKPQPKKKKKKMFRGWGMPPTEEDCL
mmetsp:Transcript_37322/g.83626  ORF Transcript_37322/g.83626 Transcript_37322/m.83626 type:complete len:364 (-) Transcript_37322:55-1146(-)